MSDATMTRSTRLGAAGLLGLGALIAGLVAYAFVSSRSACGESGYSFACDLSNIAVVVGAGVAGLHVIAGAGLWRGHTWGAVIGAVIALVGLLACIATLEHEPWWLVLPVGAAYLGTLVVLVYTLTASSRQP